MSKQIHFRHLFHAAGHGTFFTGDIVPFSNEHKFSWIYDCGSRRPSQLRGLIEDYVGTLGPAPRLDLLCVSHFDADHVNGLDELLLTCHVQKLVLPYVPLQVRLQLACHLEEDALAEAGALSALLIDPLAFLEARGYGERIGRVVFVRGGENKGGNVEHPDSVATGGDESDLRGGGELRFPEGNVLSVAEGYPASSHGLQAHVVTHLQSWAMAGIYEWVFFNKQCPNEIAPTSGKSLEEVAEAVRRLVDSYELCSKRAPRPGWLEALKKLYATHFGGTSRRRNEISLCVLGRPLVCGPIRPCRFFGDKFRWQTIEHLRVEPQKPGVLLMGDFALTANEVTTMRHHFGCRWDGIGVVQIPHHGSRHNWRVGVLDDCSRSHNVICAPGTPSHPHEDVTADLSEYLLADYDQAVAYVYHGVPVP